MKLCSWNVHNTRIVYLKILTCIYSYCVYDTSGNVDPTCFFTRKSLHYLRCWCIIKRSEVCKGLFLIFLIFFFHWMKSWLQITWWEFVFAYTWVLGFYLPETDSLPLLVCTISKRKIWKLLMYLKVEFYKYTFLLTARRWTYFIWLQCWTKWHSSAFDTFWVWSSYHCFCDRSGWRSQSLCSFQLQEQSQKNK